MLTQHGIPKPVYHALRMLREAGDARVDLGPDATLGEIGCAAFRGDGETQVLLFRQRMKNLELPAEKARITVELPKAPAAVTVRRIDETHGNPLKLWQEMGSPVQLTPAEVESLKTRSAVTDEPLDAAYADGVLSAEVELGVNDVAFIRIKE